MTFDLAQLAVARRKCETQTSRGNCYLDEASAVEAALSISLRRGLKIHAYRCRMGAHWHLGSYRTVEERRERSLHEREMVMNLGFRIVRTPYPPTARVTGIVVQKVRDNGLAGPVVGDEEKLWDALQLALLEAQDLKQALEKECACTRSLQSEIVELRAHAEKGRKR